VWGLGFLRHCTRGRNDRGLAATAMLSRDAFRYYDEMIADGLQVELRRDGLLFVAHSEAVLDLEMAELGRLGGHGIDVDITRLSGDECRDRQPVIGPHVAGGVFVKTERHLDPRQLTAALAALVTSRGAAIRTGQPVSGFAVSGGRVTAVVAGEQVPAGSVVIAAGALSVPVTRKLGVSLPMTAGKGYSVSVGTAKPPSAPMYLAESRVGATPMDGRVRLAGTIEFSGLNSRRDPRRIASLLHAARCYLTGLDFDDVAEEWAGMRPLCPDGLPVLDRVPGTQNAYLATGHSTLGITLAAVTGAHMAEFIRTGTAPLAARPFRFPSYFRRPS
jgi:D-amino-acid dehydrogenase